MKTFLRVAIAGVCTLCGAGNISLAQKGVGRGASPKLDGLYRAFPSVPQFGAAVGEAYVFSAGGDVYKGWAGMRLPAKFDFAVAGVREPGHTGKYVISGDKITFRWSNKESETASFSCRRDVKTGKMNMTIGPYYCFKLIPWNKTLDGTFEPSTYQGGFSHQQKSPPEIVDGITFSRDGQFTLLADGQSSSPTKGRYKVSGAALTLVMPSKEERAYTLHLFADHGQPPKAVLIDGRPFFAKTN